MSRNAFTPAAYSPAAWRAMDAIQRQIDFSERHLAGTSQTTAEHMREHARDAALAMALRMIAESHRQWQDVEDYDAVSVRHYRQSKLEIGGLTPPTVGVLQ